MQWLARICSLPLALLALAAAWLAVAPFTPRIPYWGAGSLISPEYIGPVLLISLAVLTVSAALSFASKANVVPAAVAALAAVASGVLLATQVAGAREIALIQPVDAFGGSRDREVELRQHLQRAF